MRRSNFSREHLAVFIPGIGGSVLAERGNLDNRVWDAGVGTALDFLKHPEALDIERELVAVGPILGLRLFGAWTPIRRYELLLDRLGDLPGARTHWGDPRQERTGANVVAFPYDFRHSVIHAAERLDFLVRDRLRDLWPGEYDERGTSSHDEPRPRLVIVAHSMGGLVARYWLAQQENWRLCRRLITLGTPHRGAPKALEVLANGIPVGKVAVGHLGGPVSTLRRWPSVFELLPRYPMITDVSTGEDPAVLLRPHEMSHRDLAWLTTDAKTAWQVHEEIQAGWSKIPREGPDVKARIGYKHGTLQQARWDGNRLTVTHDALPGTGKWAEDKGDGTVPAVSGLPVEMMNDAGTGLRVPLTHTGIVNLAEAIALVEDLEGRPPVRSAPDDEDIERPPVIGVDVADVVTVESEIDIGARIEADPRVTSDVTIFASLTELDDAGQPVAGAPQHETRLDKGATEWEGSLVAPRAGAWRVRVSANAGPGGASLVTERVVQVIDFT